MLNELNNINMKSFKAENVRGLKKINCFFGINGAGKSALSTYITHLSDKCMCFNSDFVEKKHPLGIEVTDCIDLIQHFCFWLHQNKYTKSILSLLVDN